MFIPANDIKVLDVATEDVVALICGVNAPVVALPGRSPEKTLVHVVGVRTARGRFSIYIHLFGSETEQSQMYVSDPSEVELGEYQDLESDAIHFAEAMGFMLENMNFRRLAAEDRVDLVARLPVFGVAEYGSSPRIAMDGLLSLEPLEEGPLLGGPVGDLLLGASSEQAGGPASGRSTPEERADLARLLAAL